MSQSSTPNVTEDTTVSQQLYRVTEEQADDPEAGGQYIWTVAEIVEVYPEFAPLITGDGTESLTYVHELTRVRIEPVS
jgi:hypothetical protein